MDVMVFLLGATMQLIGLLVIALKVGQVSNAMRTYARLADRIDELERTKANRYKRKVSVPGPPPQEG